MATLTPSLQVILYVLLGTSAATLILALVYVLVRSKPQSGRVASIAKLVGSITSLGTLIVAALNVSMPIGIVQTPDEGKVAIDAFYDAIQDRNFDTAYRLIHPARLDEIRKTVRTFGRDQFAETYATTREYRNRTVTMAAATGNTPGRVYAVSFDVKDEVPRNRLFESRQALVKDLGAMGLINTESVIAFVMSNLKEFYDVPADAEAEVREFILSRQFESLLDPLFISEVRRNLTVDAQIDLKPRTMTPSTAQVWRHVLQDLQLLQDGGAWRIREGLARPRAVTNYAQATAP